MFCFVYVGYLTIGGFLNISDSSLWLNSHLLSHCGLVKPYGMADLGQFWFRPDGTNHDITWANVM